MKRNCLLGIVMVVFILSCKKEQKTYLGSTAPIPEPDNVDGLVQMGSLIEFNSNSVRFSINILDAVFYKLPNYKDLMDQVSGVDAGKLTVNGINITKYTAVNNPTVYTTYQDSSGIKFATPITILTSGSSKFHAISIIDKKENPVCNGYYKIPDTLYTNRENSFVLTEVYGAEQIQVEVYLQINSINTIVSRENIALSERKVIISKEVMQSIEGTVGNGGVTIILTLKARNFIDSNGKIIQVNKETIYRKSDVIVK